MESVGCKECWDTGIVFEHRTEPESLACPTLTGKPWDGWGDCCLYLEKYCACVAGRQMKNREQPRGSR